MLISTKSKRCSDGEYMQIRFPHLLFSRQQHSTNVMQNLITQHELPKSYLWCRECLAKPVFKCPHKWICYVAVKESKWQSAILGPLWSSWEDLRCVWAPHHTVWILLHKKDEKDHIFWKIFKVGSLNMVCLSLPCMKSFKGTTLQKHIWSICEGGGACTPSAHNHW